METSEAAETTKVQIEFPSKFLTLWQGIMATPGQSLEASLREYLETDLLMGIDSL